MIASISTLATGTASPWPTFAIGRHSPSPSMLSPLRWPCTANCSNIVTASAMGIGSGQYISGCCMNRFSALFLTRRSEMWRYRAGAGMARLAPLRSSAVSGQVSPTCAELGGWFRQIKGLSEKSALHFLCCSAQTRMARAGNWRSSMRMRLGKMIPCQIGRTLS
jgi:hypothetical protein